MLLLQCRSLIGRVHDHERAEDVNFLAGEFNGIPGRREQPNRRFRTCDRIQYSNRSDLQRNRERRKILKEIFSNQRRSPIQPTCLKTPIDATNSSTSTKTSILNSQKLRTEQMSKIQENSSIKARVKKPMIHTHVNTYMHACIYPDHEV